MNLGHGELPLYAWPIAKSAPLPENSIVFSVSAPIAFDAAAIAVFASCAAASDPRSVTNTAARISLLDIVASRNSCRGRILARPLDLSPCRTQRFVRVDQTCGKPPSRSSAASGTRAQRQRGCSVAFLAFDVLSVDRATTSL